MNNLCYSVEVKSVNVNRNILISLGNLFYKLVCRETPITKSAFVRVESSSRADINASDYSLVPTSVLLERTPENVLELAFQDGYCISSINKTLNSP